MDNRRYFLLIGSSVGYVNELPGAPPHGGHWEPRLVRRRVVCALVFAVVMVLGLVRPVPVPCAPDAADLGEGELAEAIRLGKERPDDEVSQQETQPGPDAPKKKITKGIEKVLESGSVPGERRVCVLNGVEYPFRWVPAGKFTMGSPMDEPGRPDILPPWLTEVLREVEIPEGFWLMETELTREMWTSVMYYDMGVFKDDPRLPQETLSWDHLQEFCELVGKTTGLKLAPPTEAQWEYACRAGDGSAFGGELEDVAWYKGNSGGRTHCVATKKPNAWGFHDMHGNVWEFCQDIKLRGGSWQSVPSGCRAALSGFAIPWFRHAAVGARLMVVGKVESASGEGGSEGERP